MNISYYERNSEYVKLKSKLYYYIHRDIILQKYKTDFYAFNTWKEKNKEYQHNYYLKTKETKVLKAKRRYQLNKLNKSNEVKLTLQQTLEKKKRSERTKLQNHVIKIKRNIPKFRNIEFNDCKVYFD